jgi:hypothetical protein
MLPLTLATEDELSEAITTRILAEFPPILIGTLLRKNGYGYLRSRMRNFCEIARNSPVLIVTDLDTYVCPVGLRLDWIRQLSIPSGLLLRVAVREIESWLLADHDAMIGLFGRLARRRLPDKPDTLADPKDFLLDLARIGPRPVRSALRAEPGAIAKQGLGYNRLLCDLVRASWCPRRAAERSPSLRRAMDRIQELATSYVRVRQCNLPPTTLGATQALKA